MDGVVLKIDRGSKHDGPGLRTVVFLKGCPLRCKWCSTPESQQKDPILLHMETLCVRCGRCVAACPEKALWLEEIVIIDRQRCKHCGKCKDACLNNALRFSGMIMSLDEVYNVIERSRSFWNRMPGGLTISGGEVFLQFEFSKALLKKCHEAGINTNIETSCFAPMEKVQELLPYLDHVCCDVKHMDDERHRELTGVSNRQILENIQMISHEKDLILRYPVIPTYNDSEENIDATCDFIKTLGDKFNRVDLLAYHEMGTITYRRLGLEYALEGVPALSKERLILVRDRMVARGVRAVLA
ncbi:glycyl-radical enzyme activating protein [Dehalobacterium formicoaceticum]|uniref:Glycyl-radical enzyme activating protein n=1 Tax=Dehalobacterium formicoaceticum TaxID=51515 RepID=A0ABT1Y243_9FIRM|nr:glycyl-radical enzyme activating protein [Dehalobacterium formicoaceticum]MCR6544628.1 glycyl-radical enzyme activating protein [Dehalobacterium formicoaceticum]